MTSSPLTSDAIHVAAYTDTNFIGGGEKALATLVRELGEEIEVTVMATDPAVLAEVAAGRPNARTRLVTPVRNKWDLAGIAAHLRAVREVRPDVLQTNGHPWSCQYALSAGLLTPGVRTLAVHHAMIAANRRRQVWLNRLNLRRVDAQVAVSRMAANVVEEMAGVAAGTVRVIHSGVGDAHVTPVARPVEGPIVGSVGRLSPEKGYDVLLRALPGIPDATAVLVGDGADREPLERLARELGVEGRVVFAGWQQDPRPWYPAFDVFVQPSRLEALPLAIIEAMLASRPVVATRVGGVEEAVLEGETGLLTPSDDPDALARALQPLLADRDKRERMGRAGRIHAERSFSIGRMVQSYESLYKELLGSDGGRSESARR